LVLSTTSSRFTGDDRRVLQRILPHLVQLQRYAKARKTYAALMTCAAAAQARPQRLKPGERIVLATAAAGRPTP